MFTGIISFFGTAHQLRSHFKNTWKQSNHPAFRFVLLGASSFFETLITYFHSFLEYYVWHTLFSNHSSEAQIGIETKIQRRTKGVYSDIVIKWICSLRTKLLSATGCLSHARLAFNQNNQWLFATFAWCEDTCHTGYFFCGPYSACLFFFNYPNSGENFLYLKAELFTPRNWQNHPFTLLANSPYPFYDVAWTRSTSCRKDLLKTIFFLIKWSRFNFSFRSSHDTWQPIMNRFEFACATNHRLLINQDTRNQISYFKI